MPSSVSCKVNASTVSLMTALTSNSEGFIDPYLAKDNNCFTIFLARIVSRDIILSISLGADHPPASFQEEDSKK